MHHGYETTLEPIMKAAFEEVVGTSPVVDRKEVYTNDKSNSVYKDDPFGPMTTDDLDELLSDLDVGHERRLRAFRSLKANNFDD